MQSPCGPLSDSRVREAVPRESGELKVGALPWPSFQTEETTSGPWNLRLSMSGLTTSAKNPATVAAVGAEARSLFGVGVVSQGNTHGTH